VVSVDVCPLPPSNCTDEGLKLQVVPDGSPVGQFRAIACANLACGVSVTVDVPADPGATDIVFGESEIVKSGPKPLRVTDCGLLTPLSAKTMVAVSAP